LKKEITVGAYFFSNFPETAIFGTIWTPARKGLLALPYLRACRVIKHWMKIYFSVQLLVAVYCILMKPPPPSLI